MRTEDPEYVAWRLGAEQAWWKRLLDVQRPYRWHARRIIHGQVLDVGCGIGRNLRHLRGNGVGIDHNPHAVRYCREQGLQAFEPLDFEQSSFARPGRFDTLLCAHVAEHLGEAESVEVLRRWLRWIRPGGRVVLITPQERGYARDETHVAFLDAAALRRIEQALGLHHVRSYSFPFPRPVGRVFPYNEFVSISGVPLRDEGPT